MATKNTTSPKSEKATRVVNKAKKEAREKLFSRAEEEGHYELDLPSKAKNYKFEDLSIPVKFVVCFLTREENKGKMFNREDLQKNFMKEACEAGLLKGGKAKGSAVIDKVIVGQAQRWIYFNENRYFSRAINNGGSFSVKEKEYIPNLIDIVEEEKVETKKSEKKSA